MTESVTPAITTKLVPKPVVAQEKVPNKFPVVESKPEILAFESGDYPYPERMSRRSYENQKAKLQAELLKVQIWAQETGQKFAF